MDAVGQAFLAEGGTGYLQQKFALICETCGFQSTKEKLALSKFVKVLLLDMNNSVICSEYGSGVVFA